MTAAPVLVPRLEEVPVQAPAQPLLEVVGLVRRFGDRVAVNGLSFSVARGEIFGLLGPNGAGKSTTFQILAGLLRSDAGSIRFQGRPLSLTDPDLRAQVGVVFQRGSLDDQLTGEENLMLGARLYALPRALAKARVAELLARTGLADRARERVAGWSGGMRRRLELARALVHRPAVLLMDEPSQGLDEAAFRAFWEHVRQLRQRDGVTVLLTTHRPEEAQECDRLAVLDHGALVACDTPRAFISRVGGDVVVVEASDPEPLAAQLSAALSVTARVVDGHVVIERKDAHALIPRLVEAVPPGRLQSVSLRRPTLADAFLKLTGHALVNVAAEPDGPKKGKRRR